MRIGLIQTGQVADPLVGRYGEYPPMFARLISAADADFSFETWAVVKGEAAPSPDACDGWLVTGSRHGVYDDLDWVEPLKAWLRAARGAGKPMVGVCFGHQIMAEAFGGRAGKFSGGWRLGRTRYEMTLRPDWAQAAPEAPFLHAIHQDQVTALPADAHLWARAEGCAIAGALYGDPERPDAIAIQPHPECAADYTASLVDLLEGDGRAPAAVATQARHDLGEPVDNSAFGAVFARYFRKMVG